LTLVFCAIIDLNIFMKITARRTKKLKLAGIIAGVVVVLVCGGILFVKFDTAAAAEFTDNYLRPILGNNAVIAMEKWYYNTADKITQLTYRSGTSGFQFVDQTFGVSKIPISGSRLDLAPLKPLPNLIPEKNEGVWNSRPLKIFPGREIMAYTFIRPDPKRPYAYVTIVQMDQKELHLSAVAGTKQPGGPVGKPGPGVIPADIIQSGKLVAAFDGGFQYRDGEYGMIVGDTTYLPLKENIGTLVGYTNGQVKITKFTGQNLGDGVEFVRQNCPILIQYGQIYVSDEKNKKLWGRTPSYDITTWRSGLGLNKAGNILYAVGNSLTPETLANALFMAGATDAIQLDINPYWVRFNIFDNMGDGQYQTSTLTKKIQDGSKQYLHGYTKDFLYLYKNN
jgi:hypothetical protein